jgi:hypothetical protein
VSDYSTTARGIEKKVKYRLQRMNEKKAEYIALVED